MLLTHGFEPVEGTAMKSLHAVIVALVLGLPSIAFAQTESEDYVLIGEEISEDEPRWIYTWWDERGLFHGVDSLSLVPLLYRDRAERTMASDAIKLGVRIEPNRRKKEARAVRLRPNLPSGDEAAPGKTADGRDQRRATRAEQAEERAARLATLRVQLTKVEQQLAAFEEGSLLTDDAGDEFTDAQLNSRLTHLETRLEYLTGEIKALENTGS